MLLLLLVLCFVAPIVFVGVWCCHSFVMLFFCVISSLVSISSGADPGFLEKGVHMYVVGGSLCWFYHFFLKYPIKMKQFGFTNYFIFIWHLEGGGGKGVQGTVNPHCIRNWSVCMCSSWCHFLVLLTFCTFSNENLILIASNFELDRPTLRTPYISPSCHQTSKNMMMWLTAL